ncbi:hypothetical protein [Nonomuraea sp. NPDC003709]|uniref:hypothetical protein n=1 Tax=Nonomuraea sp. NPDC003709 TaxID=3154450 RepID=UPI0033B194A7
MTDALVVAYVGVGGTLAATIVSFMGTGFLQWRRNRSGERKSREQTISEVLTAAVLLTNGVQVYRTTWVDHSVLRTAAMRLLKIFPTGSVTAGWHGRVADVATEVEQDKRDLADDFHRTLTPKLERMVKALSDVSLWSERRARNVVAAALVLADAAGQLVEATAAKNPKYRQARQAFEEALKDFREAADARR